jgi:hypothetical protein
MPCPPFSYARAETQARVLARIEAGYTARGLSELGGYPCRRTLWRWARQDPGFAAQLARARDWRRAVRREAALAREAFDEGRAEAFLLRVRRGETVRALVRTPGQPNRDVLDAWKRLRPDFARALAAAARFSAELREPDWPFDQAAADRIVVRVSRGEELRAIEKEPGAPGRVALRRWRRRHPEFAAALKLAGLAGHQGRMAGRRLCTPALTARIAAHVRRGGSLASASGLDGAPHRVTLYGWMRTRPDFAREIRWAQAERDDRLLDRALEVVEGSTPQTAAADRVRLGALRRRMGQVGGGRRRR